jgi:hypothetical protein
VLFLRDGGTRGGKEEDGEQANDSAHQQLYNEDGSPSGSRGNSRFAALHESGCVHEV